MPAGSAGIDHRVLPPHRGDRRRGPDRPADRLAARFAHCASAAVRARSPPACSCWPRPASAGLTVEEGLHDDLVAAHLGLAMLLLGLLIGLAGVGPGPKPEPAEASRGLRPLTLASTRPRVGDDRRRRLRGRHRGRGQAGRSPSLARTRPAARAAVPGLPRPVHAVRRRPADRHPADPPRCYVSRGDRRARDDGGGLRPACARQAFWIAPLLLVRRSLLGAINVWPGEHAGLIVAHLALGTMLWATVVYASGAPRCAPRCRSRARSRRPEPRARRPPERMESATTPPTPSTPARRGARAVGWPLPARARARCSRRFATTSR